MLGIGLFAKEKPLLKPGKILDGRYRIERELGRGAICAVYRAHDLDLDIPVAIKVLLAEWASNREMRAAFVRGSRLAARAAHHAIVQMHFYGEAPRKMINGAPYFVMRLVEGQPLHERFQAAKERGSKLGLGFLPLARQFVEGLVVCHARNVVHMDVNPTNVMIFPDEFAVIGERATLLGFSLATTVDAPRFVLGGPMGTPGYIAPEQSDTLNLNQGADPTKIDVYAVGAMLYLALAGRLPYWVDSPLPRASTTTEALEPLHEIAPLLPADLTQLVHAMVAKDPRQRPTMSQVHKRLKPYRATATP